MPVRHEDGVVIRVFSGSSKGVTAETKNHVPVTMVEMILEPGATVTQDLPGSYNGFMYIIEGEGIFGSENTEGAEGQVLWIDRGTTGERTEVKVSAREQLRVLLYAGEPLEEKVVARTVCYEFRRGNRGGI